MPNKPTACGLKTRFEDRSAISKRGWTTKRAAASKQPSVDLSPHATLIVALRNSGYSLRQIVQQLNNLGIVATENVDTPPRSVPQPSTIKTRKYYKHDYLNAQSQDCVDEPHRRWVSITIYRHSRCLNQAPAVQAWKVGVLSLILILCGGASEFCLSFRIPWRKRWRVFDPGEATSALRLALCNST